MKSVYEEAIQYKRCVEGSPELMGALKLYAGSDVENVQLDHLGTGTSNIHYRLGQLVSGLWLATRENLIFRDARGTRFVAENYAYYLQEAREIGHKAPRVCLGARIHHPNNELGDRYFLIVEDLTQGGEVKFRPASPGDMWTIIDGEKVDYDFPDKGLDRKFELMVDELMIHL